MKDESYSDYTTERCPECGNEALPYSLDVNGKNKWQYRCRRCGFEGPLKHTMLQAVNAWNKKVKEKA